MREARSTVTLIITLYSLASRSSAPKIKVKSEGRSRLTRQGCSPVQKQSICSDRHHWMHHRHECQGLGPGGCTCRLRHRARMLMGLLQG